MQNQRFRFTPSKPNCPAEMVRDHDVWLLREKGGVIPFFAVVSIVVVAIAYVIIDLTWYVKASEQLETASRIAVKQALTRYSSLKYETNPVTNQPYTNRERYEQALATSRKSFTTAIDGMVLSQNTIVEGQAPSQNEEFVLIPGLYSDLVSPAVFTPVNPVETFNSLRLTGSTRTLILPSGPTRLITSAFIELNKRINEAAAYVPRHTMIAIDLSDASDEESHPDRPLSDQTNDPLGGRGSRPGYPDEPAGVCTGPTPPAECGDWPLIFGGPPFFDRNPAPNELGQLPQCGLPTPDPRCSDPEVMRRVHFRNDFVRKRLLQNSDSALAGAPHPSFPSGCNPNLGFPCSVTAIPPSYGTYYFVDRTSPAQPLSGQIRSAQTQAQHFQDRRVDGDRMGVVFFDQRVNWPALIKPNNDWSWMQTFLDNSPCPGMTGDPAVLPDNWAYSCPAERLIRHGIFSKKGAKRNISGAIDESIEQLQNTADNLGFSRDQSAYQKEIVLMTNGFGSCLKDDRNTQTNGCSEVYAKYQQQLLEIQTSHLPKLRRRGIALNIALSGRAGAPHRLLWRADTSSTKCMSEDQALRGGNSFVLGGNNQGVPQDAGWNGAAFGSRSEATPFFQVNTDMWNLSRQTYGRWRPVRPLAPGCDPTAPRVEPDCNGPQSSFTREVNDPFCRSIPFQLAEIGQDLARRDVIRNVPGPN